MNEYWLYAEVRLKLAKTISSIQIKRNKFPPIQEFIQQEDYEKPKKIPYVVHYDRRLKFKQDHRLDLVVSGKTLSLTSSVHLKGKI